MTVLNCINGPCEPAQIDVNDSSVFDLPDLMERCLGEESAAFALLKMFRDRLPASIAGVRNQLGRNDFPAAVAALHTLKGNAGNLSAGRLYQAAARLEAALRCEQFSDAPARMSELQREAERFLQVLPHNLDSLT